MRLTLGLLVGLLAGSVCYAQKLGTWNIQNIRMEISPKWSVFLEGQIRSLDFYNEFHYYEVKGGVNFHLRPDAIFTVGGGQYNTYSEGGDFLLPKRSDEIRLWPQITTIQKYGRLKLEHRYRLEERFYKDGRFRHRFRYRLNAYVPLVEKWRLGLQSSGEFFFSPYEPYFERLRFASGFVWKVRNSLSIQVNYLRQLDYKINDETGKSFLQIAFGWNINPFTQQEKK